MSTNEPFDNPYAADYATNDQLAGGIDLPAGQTRGMVAQTKIVGILMMVQGVMEILFGGYQLVLSLAFPDQVKEQVRQQLAGNPALQNNPGMDMDTAITVAIGTVVVIGVVTLFVGFLRVFAGTQVQQLKGRGLAFTSLGLGLLTLFTCWCFPSALGIGIYGIVVLANGSVAKAMEQVRAGHSAASVREAFSRLPG